MNAEQFDKSLNKSCGLLGTATMTFGSVSMLSCLMTISKPLDKEDDSSFMASFFLMIIAMLHHFMFWKYLKQKQEEALKESEEDHTTYTSVEMPVCGVPASVV
uniref:Transmembrane protein n=1 Tax=Phytophthora fragariae TaxID=53985 RepID=A0A6A3DCY8_9STRA|nr:hypothetical protein PF009_g31570 [Phytophthora fragariae]